MVPIIIVFGALAGVALPAIQGLVAGNVLPSEQGKIQGAFTSLTSLTAIFSPLIFTAGLFSFFTSAAAPIILPGAPFFLGSLLFLVSAGPARAAVPQASGDAGQVVSRCHSPGPFDRRPSARQIDGWRTGCRGGSKDRSRRDSNAM